MDWSVAGEVTKELLVGSFFYNCTHEILKRANTRQAQSIHDYWMGEAQKAAKPEPYKRTKSPFPLPSDPQ